MPESDALLLNSQVKSLELQLKVLKAELGEGRLEPRSFASLYGLLQGQSDTTWEEIEQAQYKLSEGLP